MTPAKWTFALFLTAGCCISSPGHAGPKPQTPLEQIFYDIGVAGYCGLSTAEVNLGFQREVQRMVARNNIDQAQINDARNRAITLVELEWDNRGLGGFRGWCRTEGQSAVDRFLAAP